MSSLLLLILLVTNLRVIMSGSGNVSKSKIRGSKSMSGAKKARSYTKKNTAMGRGKGQPKFDPNNIKAPKPFDVIGIEV